MTFPSIGAATTTIVMAAHLQPCIMTKWIRAESKELFCPMFAIKKRRIWDVVHL